MLQTGIFRLFGFFLLLQTIHCAKKDYIGGWTPSKDQCVNICFSKTVNKYAYGKMELTGDWETLVLEEMFLPQFCRDLDLGVDFTYSHQNVDVAPYGVGCKPSTTQNTFTIHGLWPNYFKGFPACCNVLNNTNNDNKPFDPLEFTRRYPDLFKEMGEKWIDPTVVSTTDSLCDIFNHEYQKHGVCYGVNSLESPDMILTAKNYFQDTLLVQNRIRSATDTLNSWVGQNKTVFLHDILALYTHNVAVLCSKKDGFNKLAAIRSCWQKNQDAKPGNQYECPPTPPSESLVECEPGHPITLEEYHFSNHC